MLFWASFFYCWFFDTINYMPAINKYEPVIGLEIHVQLKTKSKMFCSCDNTGENQPPNTTICPICTGHPGTLPVANEQAISWAIMASLALHCEINQHSHFDRKNYFYPDLPKGYQISQYSKPFGHDGYMLINSLSGESRVRLERVHLEEDTGKLMHNPEYGVTYVDYNRAGTPLLEIVTKPDIKSPAEAKIFLQNLRLAMRYLAISDADMELGHLRCDANISLRPNPEFFMEDTPPEGKLFPKTEIKNLNSFRAVERALEYEIKRQTGLWDKKTAPTIQSTRGWDEDQGVTVEQRTKEEQHDYRYFPEPDLPIFSISDLTIEKIKSTLTELPFDKVQRFISEFGMNDYDARQLISDKNLSSFFEDVISELKAWLVALETSEGTDEEIWDMNKSKLVKMVANWLINRLLSVLPGKSFSASDLKITPENFAELMTLIYEHRINQTTALVILKKMAETGQDPSDIMSQENFGQIQESQDLVAVIDAVINENQNIVSQYKSGKSAVLQFLIGQVMKKSKGQADPNEVQKLLTIKLK